MASSEVLCQLCGVSFVIFRLICEHGPPKPVNERHEGEVVGYDDNICDCRNESQVDRDCGDAPDVELRCWCYGPMYYPTCRISMEEMLGCQTVQCLMLKSQVAKWEATGVAWTPKEDDEEFEAAGKCCLTGYGWANDWTVDFVKDLRHGVTRQLITNDVEDPNGFLGKNVWAMPFHPTCFSIFKDVSRRRLGGVDADGLFDWRTAELDKQKFKDFPRHPDVKSCSDNAWQHLDDTEWLVANPVHVPGLPKLIKSIETFSDCKNPVRGVKCSPSSYDHAQSGNKITLDLDCSTKRPKSEGVEPDFFELLPPELLTAVMEYLPGKGVANLRLVTRAAEYISVTVFRHLVKKDMPWFWEVESLPSNTNWARLYVELKLHSDDIKGLKNRKRIWQDANYIVDRVEALRLSGAITS